MKKRFIIVQLLFIFLPILLLSNCWEPWTATLIVHNNTAVDTLVRLLCLTNEDTVGHNIIYHIPAYSIQTVSYSFVENLDLFDAGWNIQLQIDFYQDSIPYPIFLATIATTISRGYYGASYSVQLDYTTTYQITVQKL